MGLTMQERKGVTKETRERYGRASKKGKGRMLDWFCGLTGYNRCYAARVLRDRGEGTRRRREKKSEGAGRRSKYGPEVLGPLKRVWAIADGMCGKRLVAIMPETIRKLEQFGEIRLGKDVRALLLQMSASTTDRLLAGERRKMQLKGRSGTKPGSLLKGQIPVRTFSEWNEGAPGFFEVDLVAHEGGNAKGEYIQTLDMVDVFSGWTETRAVKNKAQVWVFEALREVRERLPFPMLGLDSDNGAEFINDELTRYCRQNSITFTRSRPYRKNDSCHVEQKNWHVVRRTVGYHRYETKEQLLTLNQLYQVLRLYTNFFQPNMKLVEKTRQGAKVSKKYDKPQTPFQRLLAFPSLSTEGKYRLAELYETLNPAQLQRDISSLQETLSALVQKQARKPKKEVTTPNHFEYILADATN
jgi:hypothetical protein